MKKHSTQFSNKEHNYLLNRFRSIPRGDWSFSKYSKKRAIERGVDLQVLNTIWTQGFDIIEYHFHEEARDNRILLRSICTDKNDNQVCAVFSLSTKTITTIYLNKRTNKHFNLVWSEYDENLDVLATAKSMTTVIK